MSWASNDIPDQSDRLAIVTGANSGIGFETARHLSLSGAHVILACRNRTGAESAVTRIRRENARGTPVAELLDLSCLDSVHAFAERCRERRLSIDLLINNAGIMIPPKGETADGFELQIGINHLGHFALTGLLLPLMRRSPDTRIVTVSSIAHRLGTIDVASFRLENFDQRKPYRAFREYRQSKLANLMFALELDRRLVSASFPFRSLAAHPGITHTRLVRHKRFLSALASFMAMSAPQGALPILFAATSPVAVGGHYYGPDGFHEIRGFPAPARVMPQAADPGMASQLWSVSQELTGVRYLAEF